jgi:hypothetical protein
MDCLIQAHGPNTINLDIDIDGQEAPSPPKWSILYIPWIVLLFPCTTKKKKKKKEKEKELA